MLQFKELELEDKEIIDKYFKVWNSDSSDMSFANLYTWACSLDVQFAIENDVLYLMRRPSCNTIVMRMPLPLDKTADLSEYIEVAKGYCFDNKLNMHMNISSEEMYIKFKNDTGDKHTIIANENYFDYVYSSQDLINLTGSKFHSKRNHINKFLSLYEPTFSLYDDSHRAECLELYSKWYFSKGEGTKEIEEEICAIDRTFCSYKELGLTGCVIKVHDKVAAFSFGEKLNDDTALIHVEKYNPELEGIGAYVNKAFVENCWADLQFVNREEDMGIEGLRRAKKSYNPVKMVKKYVIRNMVDCGE